MCVLVLLNVAETGYLRKIPYLFPYHGMSPQVSAVMPWLEYAAVHSSMHSMSVVSPCVLVASALHWDWHLAPTLVLQHVVASPSPAALTCSMQFVKQFGSWLSLSHTLVHDSP
jgi:hypothetical protein